MTNEQLHEQGEQLARQIASGLMAGAAAGAAEFASQMDDVRHQAEQRLRQKRTNDVLAIAETIETERASLADQLRDAKGLKAAGIRRRLADLDALEAEMCRRLDEEAKALTPALEAAPEPTQPADVERVSVPVVRDHNGRFAATRNGSH
jgi:flagellar motility protein MotE (MotC chaperone)